MLFVTVISPHFCNRSENRADSHGLQRDLDATTTGSRYKGTTMNENTDREVAYSSHVRIERVKGPIRRAFMPAHDGPVMFGVHSEVAEHYGVDNTVIDPHATTLDYVISAVAG